MQQREQDVYFLRRTFLLAKKAEGFTSPNPLVGAVIVKNGKIIGEGYHKRAGLPHAEIEAISSAGKKNIKGSILYVNLEPCCHFGRTPPCVDEIIKKGIKKIVIATPDPNPLVNGKSLKKLKKSGLTVKVGLLNKEAESLNEIFFKNMSTKMPFVVVKVAESLDGKIATKKGISKWITASKSRSFAKGLRDKYDCVLVGINTVLKDDPGLCGLRKIPFRAVVDPQLRIPLDSRLMQENREKLIIFSSPKAKKRLKLIPSDIKVFFIKEKKGFLPLKKILKILYRLGIMSVFVEGGSQTLGRFFDERLIDKIYFFISPKIIGGRAALSAVGGEGFWSPNFCAQIRNIEVKKLGEDILVSGYPYYGKKRFV
jgi:diaminohydroxyphosphoribosylaminopyrimidine deaminase/5-amino-6-(5-phosphoribosylamino)uracil reductase